MSSESQRYPSDINEVEPTAEDWAKSQRGLAQDSRASQFEAIRASYQQSSADSTPISFSSDIMNALRIARAATRARPSAAIRMPLQRRGYADAVTDKIKLTLALPHQVG